MPSGQKLGNYVLILLLSMGIERSMGEGHEDGHYILVVDDEEDLAGLVKDALEREGYKVLTASHPPEAFRVILEQERLGYTPFTVLTDVKMPYLNGIQFRDIFLNRYPHTEVAFITATPESIPAEFKKNGIKVINKPFNLSELYKYVAESEKRFRRKMEVPLS